MVSIKVIGLTELFKRFNGIKGWLQSELPRLTQKSAEEGKAYAVAIAPKRTRALVNAIAARKSGGKDISYTLVSRTPKGSNTRRVPYQVYLHKGKRGFYKGNVKSGDHQYMDTTARFLSHKYPEMIERSLNKQLKK